MLLFKGDISAACRRSHLCIACAAQQYLAHVLLQVAVAPAARGAAVQNIAELENEDQYHLPVDDQDREINLSLLTACLCAADQVGQVLSAVASFHSSRNTAASAVPGARQPCGTANAELTSAKAGAADRRPASPTSNRSPQEQMGACAGS